MSERVGIPDVPALPPESIHSGRIRLPEELKIRFEGFEHEAFELLEGLRQNPHIDQYRKEKAHIRSQIQDPFKRYRDDLVVNWVLPNLIGLETEKNVFSRLLKNDFGAGGCHHHVWMSFYRPGLRRLGDIQLAHSLWPEAFYIVVYIGPPAPRYFKTVHHCILADPDAFLTLLNPLLQSKTSKFQYSYGTGHLQRRHEAAEPLTELPHDFGRVKGIAVRTAFLRDHVVELGSGLVPKALASMQALWPIYRYFLEATSDIM